MFKFESLLNQHRGGTLSGHVRIDRRGVVHIPASVRNYMGLHGKLSVSLDMKNRALAIAKADGAYPTEKTFTMLGTGVSCRAALHQLGIDFENVPRQYAPIHPINEDEGIYFLADELFTR